MLEPNNGGMFSTNSNCLLWYHLGWGVELYLSAGLPAKTRRNYKCCTEISQAKAQLGEAKFFIAQLG